MLTINPLTNSGFTTKLKAITAMMKTVIITPNGTLKDLDGFCFFM